MVNRFRAWRLVAIACLVCSAATHALALGTSEEPPVIAPPADLRPRRLLVVVHSFDSDPTLARVMRESLVSALSSAANGMLVRTADHGETGPYPDPAQLIDAPRVQLEALARGHTADAYITVQLQRETPQLLRVFWRVGDVLQSVDRRGEYRTPLIGPRELHTRAWIPVLEAAREQIPPRDEAITLRLQGVPETKISIAPDTHLELDGDGRGEASLRVPGEYVVAARRPGYRDVTERIRLESATELQLEQQRKPVAYAQASLFNTQFPEFAAGWMPGRGELHLGGFVSFFQFGFALRERGDTGDQTRLAVSLPLTHVGLSAGYRFGTDQHRTRPFAGLQPFIRVSNDNGLAFESNAAFGAALNLGLEYRLFDPGVAFLEWLPTAYPTAGKVSNEDFYDGDPGTMTVSLDGLFLELTLIRLGYRHRF